MASNSITRVAIYGRVSTNNHGQDVSMQTTELEQFAQARGWQVVGQYLDSGVSGAKDSRPELNRLMADAHRRRFGVVAVWRFDRFARLGFISSELLGAGSARNGIPPSRSEQSAASVPAAWSCTPSPDPP